MKIVLSIFQISQYNNKTKLFDVPFPFGRKSTELQLPWWETPEDQHQFVWNTWDWSTSSSLVETPTRTQIIQSLHSHLKQRSTPSLGRTYHKWSWWEETSRENEQTESDELSELFVWRISQPHCYFCFWFLGIGGRKRERGGGSKLVGGRGAREFSGYGVWQKTDMILWDGGGGRGGRKEVHKLSVLEEEAWGGDRIEETQTTLESHTTTTDSNHPQTHKRANWTSCFQEIEIIIKPKKKPSCRVKRWKHWITQSTVVFVSVCLEDFLIRPQDWLVPSLLIMNCDSLK